MCIYIYIYIYKNTHMCMYIYIYTVNRSIARAANAFPLLHSLSSRALAKVHTCAWQ